MKVYGIKSCDKVRAAMKALGEDGHQPELVDMRVTPLEGAEIERFFERFGDELVNRRSTTWRGLDTAARAEPPVKLISAHPTLMKRPVVVSGDEMSLGWSADIRSFWLGKR